MTIKDVYSIAIHSKNCLNSRSCNILKYNCDVCPFDSKYGCYFSYLIGGYKIRAYRKNFLEFLIKKFPNLLLEEQENNK